MLEPIVLESPLVFPHRCPCGSGKGPIIDTHIELGNYGRLYVCELCAKTYAQKFGFADGKRLDELSEASGLLVEKEREVAVLTEQLGALAGENAILEKEVKRRDAEIEGLEGRVSQMSSTIRASAEAAREHLQLVDA